MRGGTLTCRCAAAGRRPGRRRIRPGLHGPGTQRAGGQRPVSMRWPRGWEAQPASQAGARNVGLSCRSSWQCVGPPPARARARVTCAPGAPPRLRRRPRRRAGCRRRRCRRARCGRAARARTPRPTARARAPSWAACSRTCAAPARPRWPRTPGWRPPRRGSSATMPRGWAGPAWVRARCPAGAAMH